MGNVIIDRVKNQAKNLQILSEELQVQMALGKAEARDLIKRERKVLRKYISKQLDEIEKSDDISNENRRKFLTYVENLETVLNGKIPKKAKAYDAYKNTVLKSIYELEEELREKYPSMNEEMQEMLSLFKTKMDAFRVNLALHDKDDPEKVTAIRLEFGEKLEEVRELLSKKETDQSKLDNFVEDISESFNYLKKAIGNLSN